MYVCTQLKAVWKIGQTVYTKTPSKLYYKHVWIIFDLPGHVRSCPDIVWSSGTTFRLGPLYVCIFSKDTKLMLKRYYWYNSLSLITFFCGDCIIRVFKILACFLFYPYSICVAHNNCEAVIRVLELSYDTSVIPYQHLEQVLMTHTPEQLDRVTSIVVSLFPHDLCQKISGTTWNKLLSQCCTQQRSAKAMQIFQYMSNISVKIDKEVGGALKWPALCGCGYTSVKYICNNNINHLIYLLCVLFNASWWHVYAKYTWHEFESQSAHDTSAHLIGCIWLAIFVFNRSMYHWWCYIATSDILVKLWLCWNIRCGVVATRPMLWWSVKNCWTVSTGEWCATLSFALSTLAIRWILKYKNSVCTIVIELELMIRNQSTIY